MNVFSLHEPKIPVDAIQEKKEKFITGRKQPENYSCAQCIVVVASIFLISVHFGIFKQTFSKKMASTENDAIWIMGGFLSFSCTLYIHTMTQGSLANYVSRFFCSLIYVLIALIVFACRSMHTNALIKILKRTPLTIHLKTGPFLAWFQISSLEVLRLATSSISSMY